MSRLIKYCYLLLLLPMLSMAAPAPYQAGKDYQIINSGTPQSVNNNSGNVQVIEFFSYGCPWCFKLEPSVEKWLTTKPSNVDFSRVPAVFEPKWLVLAKTYYTAQALGVEATLTPKIFNAIHVQHQNLMSEKAMGQFFAKNGVSQSSFNSAYNFSPGIDAQLSKGNALMAKYKIQQIPTIIIDGKYKVDSSMAQGDGPKLMAVVNYLVNKELQSKKANG